MTRAIVAMAVLALTACGGTDSSSGIECNPGPWTTLDGAWTISIDGVCTGSMQVSETPIPDSCGKALAATWECGSLHGSARASSFRFENYMEFALADQSGREFWHTGLVTVPFSATTYDASPVVITASR